jgi:hypothetical protein
VAGEVAEHVPYRALVDVRRRPARVVGADADNEWRSVGGRRRVWRERGGEWGSKEQKEEERPHFCR